MALGLVRDLREWREPATAEELADVETDVFAGFVLARAAAGPQFAHTTLLDFHGTLANGPTVARYISDRRHEPIGMLTAQEIAIVHYRWDNQRRVIMRPLATVTW